MAKQAAYSKAFEDLFNRLLTNAGKVPPGTDQTEMIRGTQRTQWAFPEGQMNPVNVTPFQDRSVDEQKALGLVLSQLYGAGAHYESAEAMKMQAGVGHEKNALDKKLFELFEKDKKAKEAASAVEEAPEAPPPPVAADAKVHDTDKGVVYGAAQTLGGLFNPGKEDPFSIAKPEVAAPVMAPTGQPAQKKKKNTGNLWQDGGYDQFRNR